MTGARKPSASFFAARRNGRAHLVEEDLRRVAYRHESGAVGRKTGMIDGSGEGELL
jgi:hypothetical protein